jgi:exodeoxyribonuclease VII large subunit
MSIEFADGRVGVTADGRDVTATSAAPKPEPREHKPPAQKRAAKPVDQGNLF